ncbi:phosphomevalonate kinase [Nocardia thraciensis]
MITCRAPGKLFVAGEYAVVEPGHPAMLVAVDRYATATVTETGGSTTLATDLGGGRRIRSERGEDQLLPPVPEGASADFRYVLAAVTVVERLLIESGRSPRNFELATATADLTDGAGRKLGLGSSAAVTVATVAALGRFYRLRLTTADRYRLAMLATLAVHPRGSGGDVAAATWGGWLTYRSPDRDHISALAADHGIAAALRAQWPGLSIQTLPTPQQVRLLVGWTGTPASTPTRIARISHRRRTSHDHAGFLAESDTCVTHLTAALAADNVAAVQHEIRRAAKILETLDQAAALGIATPQLRALCAAAELAGAAAKPSGAGGGDCGIAIVDRDRPDQAAELTRRWIDADIRPLDLTIHPHEGEPT